MKPHLLSLLRASFLMLILGLTIAPLHADLPHLRKAVDELQAAKKSSDPMPLLKSAKQHLTSANRGNKAGDKDDALDKIQEAMAALKAGDKRKMEQKINSAIVNINRGKNKSR
jgi:hypothetical protein